MRSRAQFIHIPAILRHRVDSSSATSRIEIILQRIHEPLCSESVFHRRNLQQFLVVTQKTPSLAATKRFPLSETTGLNLAFAIDRLLGPIMNPAKMVPVSTLGSFQFLMICLHEKFLSGSTRGVLAS